MKQEPMHLTDAERAPHEDRIKKVLSVYVRKDLIDKLKVHVKKHYGNVSFFVEKAITDAINEDEGSK